ncbi:MAG: hypothetical protein VYE68_14430 [Acidobacteriota bacterium]|nr:hypothetical protein [Acidobacteriota bacterium]
MADTWVRFVATGDPNGEGLPEWRPYSSTDRVTMVFGDEVSDGPHPAADQFGFVETYETARRATAP